MTEQKENNKIAGWECQEREQAIAEKIIRVTSHGRTVGAYFSASEAAEYERFKRRERQSLVVGDLPNDVVAAIEAAEYDAEP